MSEEILEAEFYEELGRALVAWQQIETNLWFVFGRAIGASDGFTSMKAYYAIPNFLNQWKMTDATVKAEIEDPLSNRIENADVLLTEWSEIEKALFRGEDAAYPRRNHIAHHVGSVAMVDDGNGIRGQAHPGTKKFEKNPKGIGVDDLRSMHQYFDDTAARINKFAGALTRIYVTPAPIMFSILVTPEGIEAEPIAQT